MWSMYTLRSILLLPTLFANIDRALSADNTSLVTEWKSTDINDWNLRKSKSIYSKTFIGDMIGLWVLGGISQDNTVSNSIMFLNFKTDDTTIYDDFMDKTCNVLPYAIYCNHQCSTTINTHNIAIVSPYTVNDDIIYDLWLFNSSQITVTTNISLVVEVSNPCVTSNTDSLVFVVGGTDRHNNTVDILQIYNTETQTWITTNNTMDIERSSASCEIYENKLYVFGGTTNSGIDTDTIEIYDIESDEWVLINHTLSQSTHDIQSILADNIIFNIGGYNAHSYIIDALIINDEEEEELEYEILTLPITNITHLYGIFTIHDIHERLMLISGLNANGDIVTSLEYSNPLENVTYMYTDGESTEPTMSPTIPPTESDLYNQLQNEFKNLLDSDFLDPTTWSALTTAVVIAISILVLISCLAFFQHKCHCDCCGCRGADDVEWWRLFRYSLQVYDLFTDINFSGSLWLFWKLIEENEWSEHDINEQKTYYFYSAVLSSVFLVIPYVCNLLFVLCPCGLPSLLSHPSYAEAKMWMIARANLFSVLVMLSGGAYASLTLVNSKMFGVSLFTMGLSRRQLLQFTDIQVKLSIMLENIPQLALQLSVIFNRYLHQDLYNGVVWDMVTGMSFISSAFLIVIGITSTCIIKSQHIDDLEITIDVRSIEHKKKVIRKIHQCLGLRQSIARELSLVFGCDQNVIEVPRINRTMYGCKIRLFIAKSDTLKALNDLRKKIDDISKVLSLLFRVDVQTVQFSIMATARDFSIDNDAYHSEVEKDQKAANGTAVGRADNVNEERMMAMMDQDEHEEELQASNTMKNTFRKRLDINVKMLSFDKHKTKSKSVDGKVYGALDNQMSPTDDSPVRVENIGLPHMDSTPL